MTEEERCDRITRMCREILDSEEPFYWNYDLSERQKDYTIDFLLRAVLGFAEREKEDSNMGLGYVEAKFFAAYKKITNREVSLY